MALMISVLVFFVVPTLKWQLVIVISSAGALRLSGRARNWQQAEELGIAARTDEQNFVMFIVTAAMMTIIVLLLHGIRYLIRKHRN